MPRRGRGEGTYREVRKGVYRLRVYVGRDPITGKPRQASRTVKAANDAGARRLLRRFVGELEEGQVARVGTHATVASLIEAWLAQIATTGKAVTTVETYRIVANKHLIPALGRLELGSVSARDLDLYYQAQLTAGMAARTVRLHHSILSRVFTQAVRWEWMARNPAKTANPPAVPRGVKFVPEVEQVRRLLEAAHDIELATAVALAAVTGARRGELCGLRWSDVDWQNGTLWIVRQRVRVTGGQHTVGLKHDPTGQGRTIHLDALGLEVLRRYRLEVEARAARLGVTLPPDAWLLSADCVNPLSPKWLSDSITALGKKTKVPVTTHAFRRFAATQMVGSGVDVRTAAARLGHTPDMLLRVYAGFLPARDAAAAEGLGGLVLGPTTAL